MSATLAMTLKSLKKIAEIERKVGVVYLKCAELWPEYTEIYKQIAMEEFGHEAIALEAVQILTKKPETLHSSDILDELSLEKMIKDLDILLEKLSLHVISQKNMVTAMYFLENSIVEDKYLSGLYINDAELEKKLIRLHQETGNHKSFLGEILTKL